MKEKANEKRLSLIADIIGMSDKEVLTVILQLGEPDATTKDEGEGNPPDPPPGDPPGGGG